MPKSINNDHSIKSEKETILVLASTFPRWQDDKEPRFIYDLCIRLEKEYNIILLTSHCKNSKKIDNISNIQVIRYQYAPENLEQLVYNGGITNNLKYAPWKWLLVPSFFIAQFFAIRKLLKKYPIKLIHAHWLIPQGFLAVLALKTLKKINIPLLCTSHGGDLFGLQDKLSLQIKRWVIEHSNALTVVSHAMLSPLQQLNKKSNNKTHVIPMGTDLSHLFTPKDKIKRHTDRLFFVGCLVKNKGLGTLIKAMPEVIKKYPHIQLLIAGKSPEKDFFINMSQVLKLDKSIFFIGQKSHKELSILYNKATIAIFPFQQAEGLGLVVLEALGCHCPVIVGDVPAMHDIIKNNETGIISERTNIKLLAQNIIKLLDSPEERFRLAHNGRQYALNHFSWESSSSRYNQLINTLIHHSELNFLK